MTVLHAMQYNTPDTFGERKRKGVWMEKGDGLEPSIPCFAAGALSS